MHKGGCWIFLSDSSHDIEKVRIVRNEFERLGHNPLAFHLKCLSTATEEGRHELDSLIKREIDAREWFVFCESPEAAKSPYVRDEQAYIINSGKDKVWKIDMTADIDSILDKVRKICADIEVFVSYANHDRDKIQPLIEALVRKDFSVWNSEDNLKLGDNWEKQIPDVPDAIIRCTYQGCFIVVITQESMKSSFVKHELEFAFSQGAWIVPIVLGNPEIPDDLRWWLGTYQCLHVDPRKQDFAWVVNTLEDMLKKKITNILENPGLKLLE
jgi:hypothetical protein